MIHIDLIALRAMHETGICIGASMFVARHFGRGLSSKSLLHFPLQQIAGIDCHHPLGEQRHAQHQACNSAQGAEW